MKINIIGDAYVITSELSAKDIMLVAANNPDALKIKDEQDGSIVKFSIAYSEGKPNIASFGITFGGKTKGENGKATLTGTFPTGVENKKDFVADKIGGIVAYLTKLEETVPEAAKKIAAERKALVEKITEA